MKSKQVRKLKKERKSGTAQFLRLIWPIRWMVHCCFYFMVAVILIILNVNSSVYECACVCMGSVFFGDGWMGNPSGCGGTLSLLDSELSRFSDGALDFQSMLPTFHRWNCDHVRCNEYPPSLTYSYWGISFEFLYVSYSAYYVSYSAYWLMQFLAHTSNCFIRSLDFINPEGCKG